MEFHFLFNDPTRLDVYLNDKIDGYSRSYLIKCIKQSMISIDGKIEKKPGFLLKKDSVITVNIIKPKLSRLNLKIIFENDQVIVVDKPAGILSHSKGVILEEATVSSWVIDKTTGLTGNKAGIVHRLDRATSGVMILALNGKAQLFLQKQFSTRKVTKVYYAIVEGIPKPERAIIDIPIKRNPSIPKQFMTNINGKTALTEYKVIKSNHQSNLSLVQLFPKTGRTHQLRVHLKHLGTPIAGDSLYNKSTCHKYSRMYLHAYSLTINLPNSNIPTEFIANLPKDFETLL